jgi:S-adenosyl-L-methionine hydrolase (adenosine-forming)
LTTGPIITFLSDYGLDDEFVGVCHGVIAGISPQARVIDLTHGVPRGNVRAGALILRGALGYLPDGVVLAVVDPGVGGSRRAVAVLAADGRVFVGPDNGLLSLAVDAGGGAIEAVDIGRSAFALEPVSATFHGRDIFAPVAARLAGGVALGDVGAPFAAESLVALELPRPDLVGDRRLVAHAVNVDGFGNVQLDVDATAIEHLGLAPGREVELETADGVAARARFVRTFGDAGTDELLLYQDSSRRLAVAVNQGDAAARLGLAIDDALRITLE